jgi:tetratricopeptide (TPR) repeat protein
LSNVPARTLPRVGPARAGSDSQQSPVPSELIREHAMTTPSLPSTLITAVQEQRAILFLGTGASFGAVHPKKEPMPLGDKLRDKICDQFLGGALKDRPLTAVAAMAASEVGLIHLQKYIRDVFIDFNPGDFHLLIPTFRWRAIVTTNFDLIIERAYEQSRGTIQTIVKSVKDGDLFDTRMNEVSDPVGFLKLHGCIDYYTDDTIPLILGQEQYASYAANRTRFYNRLRDLAYENPIIFCGYSISDPHIQQLLFDLTDRSINRPMYFNVAPHLDEIEVRYWSGNHVTCIVATFAEFLHDLNNKISSTARRLRRDTSADRLSLQTHYRVANATESDSLRFYLQNDVVHLHHGLVVLRQDAKEFYKGYDAGFGCIAQNLDIRRPITDSVLVDAVLLDDLHRKNGEFFLLKGPAGNGKTVALKRVAWEAATAYEKIALYANGEAGLRFDPLSEIYELTGKRIFLFVDRIALVRDELHKLLHTARSRKLPLTVIGAERENEWHIYCESLEPYTSQDFSIAYLSRIEIIDLLAMLQKHQALGLLAEKSPDERIDAFLNRAESQLLVALHETTLGLPFEKIILDEFTRIKPREAQTLYLDICALHQFGAPVRAGLISRTSGINFNNFGQHFLKPLADVVLIDEGHRPDDVFYRSRHQHVAELVFNQVLSAGEDKYDLLAKLLQAINVDYSSDRETFSRLIRGRAVAAMFTSVELGRLLYDKAEIAAKNDHFVVHQRAVFELQHSNGSLSEAEAAAARAGHLNPHSRSVRHTQAEIARRLALETSDPLRKQSYRRVARERLSGDSTKLSEYDLHTRAKVAIDELRETISKLGGASESTSSALLAATKEAETAIQKGRTEFPSHPEFLAAEADFRDLLNQAPQALVALERAFRLNPRQDWLAIRLAKRYVESGDVTKAINVMQQCLRENPSSKPAHFETAQLLRQDDASRDRIIDHLRNSFTPGDNNFEGQFWYARELFLANRASDSDSMFEQLNERAPGRFRTAASAEVARPDGKLISFDGSVSRKEEGYAFVKLIDFAVGVFASRADSARIDWDRIRTGSQIACHLGFSRKGPRAVNVTVRRT